MACHRGGHTQARICVDIGRSDKALHQFVGDVVILGQQLTRRVKCDAVWAIILDGRTEFLCDQIKGAVPVGRFAIHLGP